MPDDGAFSHAQLLLPSLLDAVLLALLTLLFASLALLRALLIACLT